MKITISMGSYHNRARKQVFDLPEQGKEAREHLAYCACGPGCQCGGPAAAISEISEEVRKKFQYPEMAEQVIMAAWLAA